MHDSISGPIPPPDLDAEGSHAASIHNHRPTLSAIDACRTNCETSTTRKSSQHGLRSDRGRIIDA